MQVLEIQSAHDLTAHLPETRRAVAHSYLVSCRQFMSVLNTSRRTPARQGPTMGFMTLAADRIWVTEDEANTIVSAIESAHSPVSLTGAIAP